MAEAVFIAFLRDQHGGLDLAVLRPDVHLARLDVEIMDGQAADAVFARQLNDGVPRVESGGGIGGGNAVAGVAADGADVADLGAAHLIHSLAQHVDVLLNEGISGNMGKAGERADPQRAVRLHGNAPEGIDAVNGDQLRAGPLALPHLHQHVTAAGDDLGLRVLQPERHSLLHTGGLIQGFHIIHGQSPSFSSWISPASLNARYSTWGVMGVVSMETPVAL